MLLLLKTYEQNQEHCHFFGEILSHTPNIACDTCSLDLFSICLEQNLSEARPIATKVAGSPCVFQ